MHHMHRIRKQTKKINAEYNICNTQLVNENTNTTKYSKRIQIWYYIYKMHISYIPNKYSIYCEEVYTTHTQTHTHSVTHMHIPMHTFRYKHIYIRYIYYVYLCGGETPKTLKLTYKVNKFIAILYEYYIHTIQIYIYIYFRLFQRILQPRNPSNNK